MIICNDDECKCLKFKKQITKLNTKLSRVELYFCSVHELCVLSSIFTLMCEWLGFHESFK